MIETPKCPYCVEEMSDLIERKEVIEAIKKYGKDALSAGRRTLDPVDDTIELCNMVEQLPAALHRAEPDESCQPLSKALRGKENATLGEILEAAEKLKQRAEPELRPLTLYEVKNRCKIPLQAEALFLEFKRGWKSYRFWPRKPTPEQMAAEKWEE